MDRQEVSIDELEVIFNKYKHLDSLIENLDTTNNFEKFILVDLWKTIRFVHYKKNTDNIF